MKRALSIIIVLSLLIIPVYAAPEGELESFSDVKESDWFYTPVMELTTGEHRLFIGTKVPVNGVGRFKPNDKMSRIEFVTVLTRYLYADDLEAYSWMSGVSPWYAVNYLVAKENGLISGDSFPFDDSYLTAPMTRQEMAYYLVKAAEITGETRPYFSLYPDSVADLGDVDEKYLESVETAYLMGLLIGTPGGKFQPLGTLTRAEAAMAVYRLVYPAARPSLDDRVYGVIFGEGERHPAAKAGDIMVLSSGAEVRLLTMSGYGGADPVLMGDDGAYHDYATGTYIDGKEYGPGDLSWYDGTVLLRDLVTNAVFSADQWTYLKETLYPWDDGIQIGETRNTWYMWSYIGSLGGYGWQWIGPDV